MKMMNDKLHVGSCKCFGVLFLIFVSILNSMVSDQKTALRKDMLSQRNSLSPEMIAEHSKSIAEKLFDEEHFKNANTIAFYLPKGSEVDTTFMIEALEGDREILVPVTTDELEMVKFTSFENLGPGKFGVLEPREKIPSSSFSDVVVVPGVAFGLCMHRLGYGLGYYDRFLSRSPAFRIGICYDFQVAEKLPTHENDQRMDMIITEKRVIRL
ncbi:TPA: 5-formyltetrahydrofolate cyclo-ligase [Candidatus Micrarchaeota archaeon]|nr:5-formyltetrahydrofolate cyclo-ligase [Candidatus Micrarchaeota archaeon]